MFNHIVAVEGNIHGIAHICAHFLIHRLHSCHRNHGCPGGFRLGIRHIRGCGLRCGRGGILRRSGCSGISSRLPGDDGFGLFPSLCRRYGCRFLRPGLDRSSGGFRCNRRCGYSRPCDIRILRRRIPGCPWVIGLLRIWRRGMPCAVFVKMPVLIPLSRAFLRCLVLLFPVSQAVLLSFRHEISVQQSGRLLLLPLRCQLNTASGKGCTGRIPRRLPSPSFVHVGLCHMVHNLLGYLNLRMIHHGEHSYLHAQHEAGQNGHIDNDKTTLQFPDHNNHHSRSCYPFPEPHRSTVWLRQCCLLSRQ